MISFGSRLYELMQQRGPACIGIDPHPHLLEQWGLSDTVAGLSAFCDRVVETAASRVAVLKPQSAFFERHGSGGISVLERTTRASREAGALVLLDVKRGDIGSTVAAYADAYLNPERPLASDAITVHPYMGPGALTEVFDTAEKHGAGVFVLARTSNPEAETVQSAMTREGRTVAECVIDTVARRNNAHDASGSHGCVMGATLSAVPKNLSAINGPILAPGVGAQGATPHDVARLFAGIPSPVLPTASRSVLSAGPDRDALARGIDAFQTSCSKVLNAAAR